MGIQEGGPKPEGRFRRGVPNTKPAPELKFRRGVPNKGPRSWVQTGHREGGPEQGVLRGQIQERGPERASPLGGGS